MTEIKNRSEILFCYDVTDANPNGDPLDGNKPRIDEETKINLVTDVRLKRTVRDYLCDYKGYNGTNNKDIFVRELPHKNEQGKESGIQDGEERASNFNSDPDNIIATCIDVRLFGGAIPSKTMIKYTGPIQFKTGRSLNKVELKYIKGTGAFASKAGNLQKTFREEYVLPYSFIAFHGIINETAAKDTNLSEEDVKEFMEALWNGTKNLISRSKFGQMPRFLLKVTYKKEAKGFFIGDLEKKIEIKNEKEINEYQVRGTNDFKLDISKLIEALKSDKIEKIEYCKCDTLQTEQNIPSEWKEMTPEWEEVKK